jgi:hypothetical protein
VYGAQVDGSTDVEIVEVPESFSADGSSEMAVQWSPTARGPLAAEVRVGLSGGAGDVAIPLAGVGIGPEVRPEAVLALDPVDLGCTSTKMWEVPNTGELATWDLQVEVNLDPEGVFSAHWGQRGPIEPGQAGFLWVSARAESAGPKRARLGVGSHGLEIATSELVFTPNETVWVEEELAVADVFRPTTTLVAFDRLSSGMWDNTPPAIRELKDLAERVLKVPGARLAVLGDQKGCVIGKHRWIDASFSTAAAREAIDAMTPFEFPLGAFDLTEQVALAVAPSAVGPGGCNQGLLDNGAHVQVVYVSDAPTKASWSAPIPTEPVVREASDPVVHAVVGDLPDGCETANAGYGYYEAVVATGGTWYSICKELPWGSRLPVPGMRPMELIKMPLREVPDPDTILVTVDGEALGGWRLAADGKTVEVPGKDVAEGATIRVRYARPPECG